jgi:glycolate oxidase FAD binding subunit
MEQRALEEMAQQAEVSTELAVRAGHAVDGIVPAAVAMPESQGALVGALAAAARHGLAVAPRGGGTKGGLGAPPARLDLVLSTVRLSRVVAYEPADLTLTVEAGMTLGELQSLLRKHGQMLPLDPPDPDRATAGGVVSAGGMGPWRYGYGSVRDLVLGLRVALPDGRHIRTGGQVMKNVAGYDMNKLFIGALGTLGVITEVTFKLRPLPEAHETLVAAFDTAASSLACAEAVLGPTLEPSAVAVLGPVAAETLGMPGPWALAVSLEGVAGAVRYQADRVWELAVQHGGRVIQTGSPEVIWDGIRHFATRFGAELVCKVSTVTAELAAQLAKAGSTDAAVAWAGSGQVYLYSEAAHRTTAEAWLKPPATGSAVLERAPADLRRTLPVWGDPGSAFPLMQGLKRSFDPGATLNPGRFVGGL